MSLTFNKKLGFWVLKIETNTQKIDGSSLKTFKIVITYFLIDYKAARPWFLEDTFLIANISTDIALEIFFLILSYAEINFLDQKLNKILYTTIEILPTTKRVELIRKKEFVDTTLDPDNKTLIIHITFLARTNVYPFYRAQIALLIQNNTPTVVFSKYADFTDIFSIILTTKLLKYTKVNNYTVDLIKAQ